MVGLGGSVVIAWRAEMGAIDRYSGDLIQLAGAKRKNAREPVASACGWRYSQAVV